MQGSFPSYNAYNNIEYSGIISYNVTAFWKATPKSIIQEYKEFINMKYVILEDEDGK